MTNRAKETQWPIRLVGLVIGGLLVRAGTVHAENSYAFLSSILNYGIASPQLATFLAATIPALQIVIGLLLIFLPNQPADAFYVAGFMFLAFAIAQALAYARGLNVSCGCFSAGDESPITPMSIGFVAVCSAFAAWGGLRTSRTTLE